MQCSWQMWAVTSHNKTEVIAKLIKKAISSGGSVIDNRCDCFNAIKQNSSHFLSEQDSNCVFLRSELAVSMTV